MGEDKSGNRDSAWGDFVKSVKSLPVCKSAVKPRGTTRRAQPPFAPHMDTWPSPHRSGKRHYSFYDLADMKVDEAVEVLPAWKPVSQPEKSSCNLGRTIERKLRSGDISIEARLDLHGMTQEKAYQVLRRFISEQAHARKRILLVITGKGAGRSGVLRQSLKSWLASMPEGHMILDVRPASTRHGGEGAYYLLLRKFVRKASIHRNHGVEQEA